MGIVTLSCIGSVGLHPEHKTVTSTIDPISISKDMCMSMASYIYSCCGSMSFIKDVFMTTTASPSAKPHIHNVVIKHACKM